jgi:ABC-type nitrate/sulfonate/bicarbonate transport system permease component
VSGASVRAPETVLRAAALRTVRLRAGIGTWLLPLSGLAFVALAWQISTVSGLVSPTIAPSFTDTVSELASLVREPSFWDDAWLTIQAWAVGLGVSILIAIPLGVLLGTSDRAYRFFRVPIESLRPVPPVVVLPLALLLLGGGLVFKVVLIVQGVIWPLLTQTVYGMRTTDPVALDTAKSFRVDLWRRLLLVRLPAAAPMISTGLRLAAATAFAVTIVTELVGGAPGLGQILILAQSGNDLVKVYAVTIFTGIAGILITSLFVLLERRLMRWQPGDAR